ncbi:MAG: peptidoglycan editing factor PgeF [Candidatus Competibacteraceae bacterium]|nr:peptidoglycan editing factor PgeF [Candidatus Competibacteraceae bacterium]
MMTNTLIYPCWPAPQRVRAAATTRSGGVSPEPFDSLNLGLGTGDDPARVLDNRHRLARWLELPTEPAWLDQVHGDGVVEAGECGFAPKADAAVAFGPGRVCAVMTADCLPVLLCDLAASRVAAVHAGWRGLAGGVLEATIRRLDIPPGQLLAWLGPAIGPEAFEVGDEVRRAFLEQDIGAGECFRPSPGGRWLADLYELARRRLAGMGVTRIFGGGWCTFTEGERFFSYRRDGTTGRMASLIWLV